jgi:hypothetical protein
MYTEVKAACTLSKALNVQDSHRLQLVVAIVLNTDSYSTVTPLLVTTGAYWAELEQ